MEHVRIIPFTSAFSALVSWLGWPSTHSSFIVNGVSSLSTTTCVVFLVVVVVWRWRGTTEIDDGFVVENLSTLLVHGSEPRSRKGRFTLTLSLFRGSSVPFVCHWASCFYFLLLSIITTHWCSCFSPARNLLFDLFRTSGVLLPFFDSQPRVIL